MWGPDKADLINERKGKQMAKRESIWPGEGSGCQETNKDSAEFDVSAFGNLIR